MTSQHQSFWFQIWMKPFCEEFAGSPCVRGDCKCGACRHPAMDWRTIRQVDDEYEWMIQVRTSTHAFLFQHTRPPLPQKECLTTSTSSKVVQDKSIHTTVQRKSPFTMWLLHKNCWQSKTYLDCLNFIMVWSHIKSGKQTTSSSVWLDKNMTTSHCLRVQIKLISLLPRDKFLISGYISVINLKIFTSERLFYIQQSFPKDKSDRCTNISPKTKQRQQLSHE